MWIEAGSSAINKKLPCTSIENMVVFRSTDAKPKYFQRKSTYSPPSYHLKSIPVPVADNPLCQSASHPVDPRTHSAVINEVKFPLWIPVVTAGRWTR